MSEQNMSDMGSSTTKGRMPHTPPMEDAASSKPGRLTEMVARSKANWSGGSHVPAQAAPEMAATPVKGGNKLGMLGQQQSMERGSAMADREKAERSKGA